jgi:hypothetical protein
MLHSDLPGFKEGCAMLARAMFAGVCLGVLTAAEAPAITIASHGRAMAAIVLPKTPTAPERTAAAELADYLGRVTGGTFEVITGDAMVPSSRIYVGPTEFAKANGTDPASLGPEEWVMRTVGEDLVLVGGRPRGTLYAAYHFLEDFVGVHWWNPFEETVPSKPTLAVEDLDRRGQPVFRYRDIYMLYGNDGGRFAARNRLNRDGDAGIAPEYGGEVGYGPPYHVHTFYMYVPPDDYFDQHPEWFSLIGGKRSHEGAQLCLTNHELRDVFVQKLKGYIESSRKEAQQAGVAPPTVFDISQNDWGGMCECERCQAIAQAEVSEAGPLLDFLNYIADAIRGEYPDVYIDTLAYMMTQTAPRTIRPRDNIIIRLCDTQSNFTKPITDPENAAFREQVASWAEIAKNLRIWDYAVTYRPLVGLPLPTVHTYPKDYRFYAEHNVEGVFTEHEYPILADMRDLKVWMMMKLLEDPYQDYRALLRTFTDGFYGNAGRFVRRYLRKLERASEVKPAYLSMGASTQQYRYLDLEFLQEAQAIFDRAEDAVAGDPVLLRRVRHARMPLDRATVARSRELMSEWTQQGRDPAEFPVDRQAVAARYKDTWHDQALLRLPPEARAQEDGAADSEVVALTARPLWVPLPERFRGLPAGAVVDYTADMSRNWQDIVKVVRDSEAETGITNRLELSDEDMAKYNLPMQWGLYDEAGRKGWPGTPIRQEDVPGPGYHWYKMGTFTLGPSYYVYFFWSWIIQFDVGSAFDPANPEQQFEIWARIRFEGPAFPHGKADEQNAICVERLVLVQSNAH